MQIRALLCLTILAFALTTSSQERLLIPIAGEALRAGAGGSLWESTITLTNVSDAPVLVKGHTHPAGCGVALCDNLDPIPPHQTLSVAVPRLGSSIGAYLTIVDAHTDAIAITQRIRDLSREYETWGTALPIAPLSMFRTRIAINDVPVGPNFRNLARIYSDAPLTAIIRVYRIDPTKGRPAPPPFDAPDTLLMEQSVNLVRSTDFAPGTGEAYLDSIPGSTAGDRLRLEITAPSPIWAFVSTTHNTTQHVTIETPMAR